MGRSRKKKARLITVKAAAARLDCQPKTVREAFHAGQIHGEQLRKLIRIYWPLRYRRSRVGSG